MKKARKLTNDKRKDDKAFTIIELLGVLIILAIISLITIPIVDKSLENSREAAYRRAVNNIIHAAKEYGTSNDLGYSPKRSPLFVSELQDEGFLTLNIKSPIDESEMNGCVWYYWDEDHKQYIFEYDNECIIEVPAIDIIYNKELINSNGWAKENIAATLVGTGEIKYCISNSECEPTEAVVNGSNTKFITNEGTSYICASSTNILEESVSLCKNFNLDKTSPTIDGLESITVDKDESVELTSGVKVDDNLSGIDGTYTITPNTVDTSTAGTKNVTYSVSDMAGNVTTKNRTIEVISEPPVIVFNVEGNPFNSNNWSRENVTIRIDVTDNSGLGIKEIRYCKGTGECEPTTTIENGGTVTLEENSATNKICVEAIDNNNTSNRICSNNYQIDKVLPTIDSIGDIKVNRNEVVNLTSGVTYNDGLSGIDGELIVTPSTVDTSTIGTKQVTYRVVDKAGNVREVVRNIIVEANAPTIVFNLVDSSAINSNGWAKSDFYLRATITDNSGTGIASGSSCTTNSSSECTPIASFTGTTKDFLISVEGSNRACVQVTDNNNKTTKVCSDTYKLDKTVPTAGTATFSGTAGSNNWYISNVAVNVKDGSDALSGHASTTSNISSITNNTKGTTVTITTIDLAGNAATRDYIIKVDKAIPNKPTVIMKKNNSGGATYISDTWSNQRIYVELKNSGSSASGIRKYQYSYNKSTWNDMSGNSMYVSEEGITNIYFRVMNNAGMYSDATNLNIIKIDITKPSAPNLTMTKSKSGTRYVANTWSNEIVKVSLSYNKNDTSGIAYYEYSRDNKNWTKVSSSVNIDSYHILPNDWITSYYFKAIDNAGNVGETYREYIKVDTVQLGKMEADFRKNSTRGEKYSTGTWSNKKVYVKLSVGVGPSGLSHYEYSYNGTTWNKITGDTMIISKEGTTDVYFRGVNNAGTPSYKIGKYTIKVDTVAPSAPTVVWKKNSTSGPSYTPGTTTDTSVYAVLSYNKTDTSGLDHYEYFIVGNSSWHKLAYNWTGWTATTWNGTANVKFRVVDKAGNLGAETKLYTVKIYR